MKRSDLVGLRAMPLADAMSTLRAYFATPEGEAALVAAPGVASHSGMRPMTADDAVAALMEEIANG